MDAVNAFNQELFSLLDMKPPISRAKMISITKSAIKAIKLYKHVVQIVEKFIKRCKPEYKVPGLYVVDSIVRQSRHQFGPEKDVFGPRFTKNITGTFQNLYLCPAEDKSKIVRVLNLWQKNGVFKIEIIQPLLDMAAGSTSSVVETDLENDTGNAGSPSPVKVLVEPPPTLATNLAPAVPQLPNSDAFAAVAQLFQSTQGQQLQQILQTFQQPPKPQSPVVDNTMVQVQVLSSHLKSPSSQPNELKTTFDKKLLDRFDYDDEPEGGEEFKKEDSTPPPIPAFGLPDCIPQPAFSQHPGHVPNMEHFQQHMVGLQQDLSLQVHLPPNGEIHGYGLMPPAQFPPVVQSVPPILPPPTTSVSSFPPNFTPQNEPFTQKPSQQDVIMEADPAVVKDVKHRPDNRRSRSKSASRSPKRRRSRSNSRCRRSRHRRSRSRSRDRRRHSPRSRSQERREREKERERRQKGLPPLKTETLSVCSTTLWVGQLDKRTQQQDVASLLEEFGQIESINMIPPRGCAYIVMVHRQDAYRALQKLSRGSFKVNQKAIKIAWALNKGIKPEYKQYWDVELGVTYVPWIKVKMEDLDSFCEGGILDIETLCPEWKNISNDAVQTDEKTHNGGSESVPTEEASVAAVAQVTGVPPIPVQPPTFPGHMGIPPPGFPPGIPPPPPPPPPPFLRPGFNPLQMPPGFLPPAPLPPLGTGASLPTNNSSVVPVSAPQINPKEDSNQDSGRNFIASVPRNASETTDGTKIYGAVPGLNSGINPGLPAPSLHVSLQSQISVHGNQTGGPTGPVMNIPPPSGGLLGARPGMIPLQRPPGVPPPHLQRFPILPPRPNVPMPPQMMQRGPPPGPGGFGMPPPHTVRAPFSPHGPFVRQGGPGAPAGSRGPEGPEERDARQFRNDRQSFGHGRDRDQERFARRSFSGSGRGEPDGRDRYSNRHDDYERPVGGRDRRDWGRSPEHDRHRDFEDRNKVSSSYRDRDRISRDRESCRDRVDSHVKDKSELDNSDKTEKYGHANNKEPPTDSGKESIKSESETAKVCDMPVDPKSEPNLSTEEIRNTEQAQ
uniref:Splicing factor, arginine/serine-rich 15 n=1 Tax=Erpetoichthys calabaricus TaxID=27687 RepID=A0A8C4RPC5_ERPCA